MLWTLGTLIQTRKIHPAGVSATRTSLDPEQRSSRQLIRLDGFLKAFGTQTIPEQKRGLLPESLKEQLGLNRIQELRVRVRVPLC